MTSFIGGLVRDARKAMGLSQTQLADRASLGIHAVWELERRGNGTIAVFEAVAGIVELRLTGLPAGRSIGERVAKARAKRGWSLQTLAERSGLAKSTLIRLEQGRSRVASLEAVLAVLAPSARARKPEKANWSGGRRDARFTPPSLVQTLEGVFGTFDLDPCGHPDAPFQPMIVFTIEEDGLALPWIGQRAFVNPPYSNVVEFIRKAHAEWASGRCGKVVMLLPVRTNGAVFHEVIAPYADTFFLRHRIAFHSADGPLGLAAFGCKIVVFGGTKVDAEKLSSALPCVHLAAAHLKSEL